jgi:hypothetical protein
MCVSAGPARLTGTILYGGVVDHPVHGLIHVLGYQNTPQNLADGPNAMLLHLPGVVTQANFIDTSACPSILREMVEAVEPPSRSPAVQMAAGSVEVFDHDIYTVVLASSASLVSDALAQVPLRRRASVSAELLDFYAENYPDCAIALCCFDTKDAREAGPLLIWYTPHDPSVLSLPAVDCHTGEVPDLSAEVTADHWVILGSSRAGTPIARPPTVAEFLPSHVIGRRFDGPTPNGDFRISHMDLLLNDDLSGLRRVGSLAPHRETSHQTSWVVQGAGVPLILRRTPSSKVRTRLRSGSMVPRWTVRLFTSRRRRTQSSSSSSSPVLPLGSIPVTVKPVSMLRRISGWSPSALLAKVANGQACRMPISTTKYLYSSRSRISCSLAMPADTSRPHNGSVSPVRLGGRAGTALPPSAGQAERSGRASKVWSAQIWRVVSPG